VKFLRKSSLITAILLVTWLCTSFSFSMEMECSCCLKYKYQSACNEKRHAKQLSFRYKDHQGNYHHYQEYSRCHQEGNHCSCFKCGNFDTNKTLSSKTYLTEKEKKQVVALVQDILERKIPLPENIVTCLERKPTTKFISLFLANSSFLL